ncbi:hypothetical protein GALMADRAFT_149284 [Galerina marginata CBS 339.88]|uniref:Uncharacterized protein n=1 Tax=Galerina marginata (strain CBS 339.88) TaxID=685588 RepID=A0A067S4K9_GALM3|nr:hypothetical protein GALMADRAFT_149284 [Galerina marginata CBS 339.88]
MALAYGPAAEEMVTLMMDPAYPVLPTLHTDVYGVWNSGVQNSTAEYRRRLVDTAFQVEINHLKALEWSVIAGETRPGVDLPATLCRTV